MIYFFLSVGEEFMLYLHNYNNILCHLIENAKTIFSPGNNDSIILKQRIILLFSGLWRRGEGVGNSKDKTKVSFLKDEQYWKHFILLRMFCLGYFLFERKLRVFHASSNSADVIIDICTRTYEKSVSINITSYYPRPTRRVYYTFIIFR